MRRYQDRVCLVTGAASGIGRATCLRLAQEGARITAVDLSSRGKEALLDELGRNSAVYVKADVADPEQVEDAVEQCVAAWGGIDVLVNNAAVMTFDPVVSLSLDDWDRVLAVNLRAPFLFAKLSCARMKPGSSIVNVTSVHAHRTTPRVAPYAAAKAGLEALTRALSAEFAPLRIRVNSVAPGGVDTPMLWSNPDVPRDLRKFRVQPGTTQQLAAAIAFLASDDASFVSGATLAVDGGQLAQL